MLWNVPLPLNNNKWDWMNNKLINSWIKSSSKTSWLTSVGLSAKISTNLPLRPRKKSLFRSGIGEVTGNKSLFTEKATFYQWFAAKIIKKLIATLTCSALTSPNSIGCLPNPRVIVAKSLINLFKNNVK